MKRNLYNNRSVTQKSKLLLIGFIFATLFFSNCSDTDKPSTAEANQNWKLICIGDGNTIGLGLDYKFTYPALLQQGQEKSEKIKVVNAGITGETIKGINQRIEWILQQRFDAILIAQNSRDISSEQLKEWDQCLQKIRWSNPDALIMVGIISSKLKHPAVLSFFEPLSKKYNIKTLDFYLSTNSEKNHWWQHNDENLSIAGHKKIAEKVQLSLKKN